MNIAFDKFDRHEPLAITLCNPGSTRNATTGELSNVVGIIGNASDEELCLNFNSTSSLSFRVYEYGEEDYETKDTLVWDGDVTGKTTISFSGATFVKMSDEYIPSSKMTGELLQTTNISTGAITSITLDGSRAGSPGPNVYVLSGLLVADDDAEAGGISIEKGVWFQKNDTSYISFFSNPLTKTVTIEDVFNKITNRRLLYVKDFGYFSITDVSRGKDEDGIFYKDVEATSAETEISNRTLPYIEDGTYPFLTQTTSEGTTQGLFNKLVAALPLWTAGTVAATVGSLYRSFEDVDTEQNILAFMLEDMQDAYECIFVFDTINRTINVYDQNNYSAQTSIHIGHEDLIKSFSISENSDDLYTALSVSGGDDDTSIAAIMPTGDSVIYKFDYYLDWMSSALSTKVQTWESAINGLVGSGGAFRTIVDSYYDKLAEVVTAQAEVDRLTILKTMYERCLQNVVAEINSSTTVTDSAKELVEKVNTVVSEYGGTTISTTSVTVESLKAAITALITSTSSSLATAQTTLATKTSEKNTLKAQRDAYPNTYKLTNYFTASEQAELANYIYEGAYSDEYIALTDNMTWSEKFDQLEEMYARAKKTLDKVSLPTSEFNIDVENFVFVKDYEGFTNQLAVGCTINAELEPDEVTLLFLTNVTINYDDDTMSMTFGNRYGKFDAKSLFEDVLGSVERSSNSIDYIKDTIYPVKQGAISELQQQMQTVRNVSMADAMANTDEQVLIDGSGITSRRYNTTTDEYDDEQIKINGKNIVFTDDSWDSCKMAIGKVGYTDTKGVTQSKYGVNAEVLYGDLVAGDKVVFGGILQSADGTSFNVDLDNNTMSCRFTSLSIKDPESTAASPKPDKAVATEAYADSVISVDINAEKSQILSEITKQVSPVTENVSSLTSRVEQTEEGVKISTALDNSVRTWMSFNSDYLEIGKSGSDIVSRQDNDSYQYVDTSGDTDNVVFSIDTYGTHSKLVDVDGQVTYSVASDNDRDYLWATRRGAMVSGFGYNLNDVWIGG